MHDVPPRVHQTRRAKIVLLDDTLLDVVIQSSTVTDDLLEYALRNAGISDRSFFGLAFMDSGACDGLGSAHDCTGAPVEWGRAVPRQPLWLLKGTRVIDHDFLQAFASDNLEPARPQHAILTLHLLVRFWPERVELLDDLQCIEWFFLQLVQLFRQGVLVAALSETYELAALVCGARYMRAGDWAAGASVDGLARQVVPYVLPAHVLNDVPLNQAAAEVHRSLPLAARDAHNLTASPDRHTPAAHDRIGRFDLSTLLTPAACMVKFLQLVQTLPNYGITFYEVADRAGQIHLIGISSAGISQHDADCQRRLRRQFLWRKLANIFHDDRLFVFEVIQQTKGNRLSTSNEHLVDGDAASELTSDSGICDLRSSAYSTKSLHCNGASVLKKYVWTTPSPQVAKSIWSAAASQHQFTVEYRKMRTTKHTKSMSDLVNGLSNNQQPRPASRGMGGSVAAQVEMRRSQAAAASETRSARPASARVNPAVADPEIRALQDRQAALELKLAKLIEQLKANCLEEGRITGKLPKEYPFAPGEHPPVLPKRVGTGFSVSSQVNLEVPDSAASQELQDLILAHETQKKIVEAYQGLASAKGLDKTTAKRRKQDVKAAQIKEAELAQKLKEFSLERNSSRSDSTPVSYRSSSMSLQSTVSLQSSASSSLCSDATSHGEGRQMALQRLPSGSVVSAQTQRPHMDLAQPFIRTSSDSHVDHLASCLSANGSVDSGVNSCTSRQLYGSGPLSPGAAGRRGSDLPLRPIAVRPQSPAGLSRRSAVDVPSNQAAAKLLPRSPARAFESNAIFGSMERHGHYLGESLSITSGNDSISPSSSSSLQPTNTSTLEMDSPVTLRRNRDRSSAERSAHRQAALYADNQTYVSNNAAYQTYYRRQMYSNFSQMSRSELARDDALADQLAPLEQPPYAAQTLQRLPAGATLLPDTPRYRPVMLDTSGGTVDAPDRRRSRDLLPPDPPQALLSPSRSLGDLYLAAQQIQQRQRRELAAARASTPGRADAPCFFPAAAEVGPPPLPATAHRPASRMPSDSGSSGSASSAAHERAAAQLAAAARPAQHQAVARQASECRIRADSQPLLSSTQRRVERAGSSEPAATGSADSGGYMSTSLLAASCAATAAPPAGRGSAWTASEPPDAAPMPNRNSRFYIEYTGAQPAPFAERTNSGGAGRLSVSRGSLVTTTAAPNGAQATLLLEPVGAEPDSPGAQLPAPPYDQVIALRRQAEHFAVAQLQPSSSGGAVAMDESLPTAPLAGHRRRSNSNVQQMTSVSERAAAAGFSPPSPYSPLAPGAANQFGRFHAYGPAHPALHSYPSLDQSAASDYINQPIVWPAPAAVRRLDENMNASAEADADCLAAAEGAANQSLALPRGLGEDFASNVYAELGWGATGSPMRPVQMRQSSPQVLQGRARHPTDDQTPRPSHRTHAHLPTLV